MNLAISLYDFLKIYSQCKFYIKDLQSQGCFVYEFNYFNLDPPKNPKNKRDFFKLFKYRIFSKVLFISCINNNTAVADFSEFIMNNIDKLKPIELASDLFYKKYHLEEPENFTEKWTKRIGQLVTEFHADIDYSVLADIAATMEGFNVR